MTSKKQRRPKGSGTVRNRGTERNPIWSASYWVVVDGKRRQITKQPFRRKVDAEAWLQGELQRAREGRPTLPSKIKVGELLDEWLTVRRTGLEPNTYREYERIAERRIKPH